MHQGKEEQAYTVIKRIRSNSKHEAIKGEFELLKGNVEKQKINQQGQSKSSNFKKLINEPPVWKPFVIIITMALIQQFSGMTVLRAYGVTIFNEIFEDRNGHGAQTVEVNCTIVLDSEAATGETSIKAYASAIVLTMVRLLASITLSGLFLRYRRRLLYFISSGISIVSLLAFSTFIMFSMSTDAVDLYGSLALISSCAIVFGVQVGVQTIPTLLASELFPSNLRAWCKGLARCIAYLLIFCKLTDLSTTEIQHWDFRDILSLCSWFDIGSANSLFDTTRNKKCQPRTCRIFFHPCQNGILHRNS